MTDVRWHKITTVTFIMAMAGYIFVSWFVTQDGTRGTFDSIQMSHIFGIDDAYRFYLSSELFSNIGMWFWSYYLPGNFVIDGFLSLLTGHDQFIMRSSHIILYLSGIWLTQKSGLRLGIPYKWIWLSSIILLLMPLNILISMSFYGELLLAFLIGLSIYAHTYKIPSLAIASISIMPFIRPEGAFYLMAVFFNKIINKKYKESILIATPSLIYIFFIAVHFDFDIIDYFYWRVALVLFTSYLPGHANQIYNVVEPFFTINIAWWVIGFTGLFLSSVKVLRPLFFGATIVIFFYVVGAFFSGRNETRYFFSIFPLFMISQASAFFCIENILRKNNVRLAKHIVYTIIAFILFENLLQVDVLRNRYFNGKRFPITIVSGGRESFQIQNGEMIYKLTAQVKRIILTHAKKNKNIDKVIIHPLPLLYEIKRSELPSRIELDFSFIDSRGVNDYLSGHFFTIFPEKEQYSIIKFYPSKYKYNSNSKKEALYIDYSFGRPSNDKGLSPIFSNELYKVYLVTYQTYSYH